MVQLTVRTPGKPAVVYRIEQPSITLGRSAQCDIVVDDPRTSRTQSEVRREGEHWVVADLASRNGTQLNGTWLERPMRLSDGDQLLCGETAVLVAVGAALEATRSEAESLTRSHATYGTGDGRAASVLVGRSPAMRELHELIERMAAGVRRRWRGATWRCSGRDRRSMSLFRKGARLRIVPRRTLCCIVPARATATISRSHGRSWRGYLPT